MKLENEHLSTLELKFVGNAEDHFTRVLKEQMRLHEGITFFDLLKFLYQSSLGPFHLFEMMDETRLRNWIRKNLEDAKPSDGPLTERLCSRKWFRLNLGPYKKNHGNDYQRIHRAFMTVKSMKQGELKEYKLLLRKLVDAMKKGKIIPANEEPNILLHVKKFLKDYETKDYPPIHHSKIYMLKNNSEYLVLPCSALDEVKFT